MEEILNANGIKPYAKLAEEDNKAQSTLITSSMQDKKGDLKIITVTNTDYDPVVDTMILPKGKYNLVELDDNVNVVCEESETQVKFTLGALESFALYSEN